MTTTLPRRAIRATSVQTLTKHYLLILRGKLQLKNIAEKNKVKTSRPCGLGFQSRKGKRSVKNIGE
jgi:hypothetical protein